MNPDNETMAEKAPAPEPIDFESEELRITGTEVHYYALCPRKLWWFSHDMDQESGDGGVGQSNVALGKLIDADAYGRRTRRNVMIDGVVKIDFIGDGVVHEVKKSRGGKSAAVYQVLYYLYYLKRNKGIVTTGLIEYPKERRREEVILTPELELEMEAFLEALRRVREQPTPPEPKVSRSLCRKCAYEELCWG